MAMNRTLLELELELSCPAGTSGTAVTPPPRGRQLKPDTTTAVYKSRQAGRRRQGKQRWFGRGGREL